jgi:hypothetical protein
MKVIKALILVLITALLVPALVFLEIGVAASGTVFSKSYFNSVFDRSFTAASIETLASGISSDPKAVPETLGEMLNSKDGKAWLKSELPKLAKGCFEYFTSDKGTLPVVDIKPLKTSLIDAYVDQALSEGGGDAAVIKQMVRSELGIDTMKDKLDLNALAKNAYGAEANPVSGFGPMITGVGSNLLLLNIALVVILLALVAVIAFRGADILRWLGAAFVLSGAVTLIPPAAAFVFNGALKAGLAQSLGIGAEPGMLFIRDWMMAYLNGIALFLLIASAVVLAAGIVMLALARRAGYSGGEGSSHATVRAVAALVLVAAIPVALYVFGKAVWVKAEKYDNVIRMADRVEDRLPFGQALDKTLNTKLFSKIWK